ncbi:dipeptidase [Ornithinimicrobium faecis]|uniref:dipeptidase n=1 Tax=Ornithinimicrobium faecis TaxID=2934158 RepID=UPI0021173892|nr:membrane dipeptidase [Ornithinimicrobium sp. HY1745]
MSATTYTPSTIIEGHRDCYEQLYRRSIGEDNPISDRLIPRLQQGGVSVTVYSVGGDSIAHSNSRERPFLATAENIMELKALAGRSSIITTAADLDRIAGSDTPGFVMHLEGGKPFEGSMGAAETLVELGVRSVQPTWNLRNELGDGVREADTDGGLTRFGRDVVALLQRNGVVIDLAHASEATFWDVLKHAPQRPVIVSHCNARTVYDHPRNLTDQQITAIAEQGGTVGVHALPTFVKGEGSTVSDVIAHVRHMVDLVGVEGVALGLDFVKSDGPRPAREPLFHDPLAPPPETTGLGEIDELANLTAEMLSSGFTEAEVDQIYGQNTLRILRQTLPSGEEAKA